MKWRPLQAATLAVLVSAGGGAAYAQQSDAAPQTGAPLAQVGDRVVTMGDVDERWRADSPAEYTKTTEALYDGRRAALDAIIADLLLDRAAKSAGLSRDEYERAELARRAAPVTDGDVEALYVSNRAQMQGLSLQEMRPVLREFLETQGRGRARAALIEELKRSEPLLRDTLAPPRDRLELAGDEPSRGPADARVTIVQFADFQCPFCRQSAAVLEQLLARYGNDIRIVWKDLPLRQIHPQAFAAAQAGRCANEQGRFWSYHDRLFANQRALDPSALKQYARDIALDAAQFDACLDSSKHRRGVEDAISAAARLGISATPTTYINGRRISGLKSYEEFAALLDDELARTGSH